VNLADDRDGRRCGTTPFPTDRHDYTVRYREFLPSTKHDLSRAITVVLRIARRCDFPTDHHADLEIALREALANAMGHGNGYSVNKRVYLRCYGIPGSSLVLAVRDQGDGFDPAGVPDPRTGDRMQLHHGRGLFLMRELMDYVEYRKDGREVLLYKSCLGRPRLGSGTE